MTDESRETLVTEAADEFLECVERGERPDLEDYVCRFPEVADVLRDILPALGAMQRSGSSPDDVLELSTPPEFGGTLGDYRILREIGRGGMGVVYEAEQISLQRRVALKVLPFAAALDAKRLERFKNEAQAAARLHHANIVPVYAIGCERGAYYYAMQMIDGVSLADVISQFRQLAKPVPPASTSLPPAVAGESDVLDEFLRPRNEPPIPEGSDQTQAHAEAAFSTIRTASASDFFCTVARLGIQAAEALQHAHSQDIIHRDIKPANLLVDEGGNLWVTDFGLARLQTDAQLTMSGDILGTYRYMSPEQALGKNMLVDHRTDIYSLGATLYELLTLQPVFEGDGREQLLNLVATRDPVGLRRLNPAIPVDLETIILKTLGKEPQDRYATAEDLAADLHCFLEGRPIRARRPSGLEMVAKWSRRHKSLVASTVVILMLAVLGLSISNFLVAREKAKVQDAYLQVARQQSTTEAALREEARQRAIAERNFRQAHEILDALVQVSVDGVLQDAAAEDVHSDLLQASLQYYEQFIQEASEDPQLQSQMAVAYLRVAKILDAIGSTPASKAALQKALEIQEQLVRNRPYDAGLRRTLFAMYYDQGDLRGRLHTSLIGRDAIQRHLELSEEQVEAVNAALDQQRRANRQFIDSHETDPTQWRKAFQQTADEAQEAITQILTPPQEARLDQIVLQRRGTRAFTDADVAEALGLTAEQKVRISVLREEASASSRSGPWSIPPGAQSLNDRVLAVLTDEQTARWKELQGEPFGGDWREFHRRRSSFGRRSGKKPS